MTSILLCSGLSKDVTEDHLRDLLSRHGRVRNVKLRIVGGVSTGQASAHLTADGGITKALNALNGSPIGRGRLKVLVQDDLDQSRAHAAEQRRAQNAAYGAGDASSSFDELMQGYLAERRLGHPGEITSHHAVSPGAGSRVADFPPQAQDSQTRFSITGITAGVREEQIKHMFAAYGTVNSVEFSRKDGKLSGNGAVWMTCRHDPEAVRARLHDAPLHGGKLKVRVSAVDDRSPDIGRTDAPAYRSQTSRADHPPDRYLFDQPSSPDSKEPRNVSEPPASLLQGVADPMRSRSPGPEDTRAQPSASGVQPSSTTTQLIADLLTDDDSGADTCAIPALGFGFGSSSSSASSSLGGSGEMMQGSLASRSTISVGNVGAADAAALGLALGRLMPTQSAEEVEFALQALMLLPPKQRKMCLFNPAWLRVKVKAALALLQAEPTGLQ